MQTPDHGTPVALSMERWIRGAAVALCAACSARSGPDATPTPAQKKAGSTYELQMHEPKPTGLCKNDTS
eukprot:1138355-Pelagomonas_calceolata.AAC.3